MKTTVKTVSKTDVGQSNTGNSDAATSTLPYEAPVLICYGDVRDVTLGPTLGEGESGCAGIFRPGPGGCPGP